MRIHEFAKQFSLTSKEIITILEGKGIETKSHMSVLSDEALKILNSYIANKKSPVTVEQLPVKKQKAVEATKVVLLQEEKKAEPVIVAQASEKKEVPATKNTESSTKKNNQKEDEKVSQNSLDKGVLLVEPMTLGDFAQKININASEIVLTFLKQGKIYSKNHLLAKEEVENLCRHYDIEMVAAPVKTVGIDYGKPLKAVQGELKKTPVVVIMGHVDHGKTTLLDYIRKTRVAEKEKGGITQHLGAYQVHTKHGDVVFLDTPGHEAFAKIRKRGASVADIAILIVAADDGVMPQTIESIKAIKALEMPVIVAINKVDRVEESRLEIIKRQLVQHDLLPEEWGGPVICVPISGKTGAGVDLLLEMIVLQADLLELTTSLEGSAEGYVLESKMQHGRGPVATVIVRTGTLSVGDHCKVGDNTVLKVTSLVDSYGASLKSVGPSVPVVVTGFDDSPAVGSLITKISEEEYKKVKGATQQTAPSFNSTHVAMQEIENNNVFNIILKADTHSSLEAIIDGIKKNSKKETKEIFIVRSGVGNITESNVLLAESTKSIIIGFSVKTEHNATVLARRSGIVIYSFDIIYKLFEELEILTTKEKEVKKVLTKIGEAAVLKVFDIKKFGIVAGCIIKEGRFSEKGKVVVFRGKKQIGEGKIKSLQRDKKSVKEVHAGFECAFVVTGFEEWQQDDVVHCFLEIVS